METHEFGGSLNPRMKDCYKCGKPRTDKVHLTADVIADFHARFNELQKQLEVYGFSTVAYDVDGIHHNLSIILEDATNGN